MPPSPRKKLAGDVALVFANHVLEAMPEIEDAARKGHTVSLSSKISILKDKGGTWRVRINAGYPIVSRRARRYSVELDTDQLDLFGG